MNSRQVASRLNEAELQRYASAPLWASPGVALPWPEALRDKPSLAAAWSSMPRPAAAALNIILGRFGALPFKEEQMLGFSEPGIAGADYRIGLLMLAESGIIFAVRKGWGEKLYFLPRDTFLPWHHTLFGSFIPPAAGAVGDADIIFEENDVYIPELGLQLLHALAELVRSGMHKTVKGMLTKRTIEKCSSQMAVQPRDLSLIGLKSVPFAEYPLPLAFVLEIASRKGWLSEDVDAFRLHSGRLQEWFELTGEQRESGLLQLMIEQYAVLDSSIAGAAAVTAALASGQWYRISDVEKQVDQHAFTGDKEGLTPVLRWVGLMKACGYMELMATASGDGLFRWLISPDLVLTQSAKEFAEPIAVSPDGDIYVSAYVPAAVRWELEMVWERKVVDVITIYRVNEKAALKAMERRFTCADVIAMLERAADQPLPEPLRFAIEGWMQQDSVPGNMERRARLPLDGVHPTEIKLYIQDPCALHAYELLTEVPSVRSLFGGLEEVSSMWVKQLRSYHVSTRRELLEKALSWRTAVKLQREEGLQLFVPHEIQDYDGQWAVIGHIHGDGADMRSELRLKPDMWGEMMLVIPLESD